MSELEKVLQRLEDLERRINQMVVRGKIKDVKASPPRAKVEYGESLTTAWLPWKPIKTGKAIIWWAPEVGEGVTVISNGDLSQGEIHPGSYHDDFKPPSTDLNAFHINFGDDSTIDYNRESHALALDFKGNVAAVVDGKTTLEAKGGAEITGEVKIIGGLHVTKDIKGDGEVADKVRAMSKDRTIFNAHGHSYSWSDPGGSGSTAPPTPRK